MSTAGHGDHESSPTPSTTASTTVGVPDLREDPAVTETASEPDEWAAPAPGAGSGTGFGHAGEAVREALDASFSAYHLTRNRTRRPLQSVDAATVAAEAIEQVMRVSDDEDLLLALLSATPGTPEAAVVAGQVMSAGPVRLSLTPGCPVLAFATGSSMNVGWRRWCHPAPGSLFAELLLYRDLTTGDQCSPVEDFPDAYAELESARTLLL